MQLPTALADIGWLDWALLAVLAVFTVLAPLAGYSLVAGGVV